MKIASLALLNLFLSFSLLADIENGNSQETAIEQLQEQPALLDAGEELNQNNADENIEQQLTSQPEAINTTENIPTNIPEKIDEPKPAEVEKPVEVQEPVEVQPSEAQPAEEQKPVEEQKPIEEPKQIEEPKIVEEPKQSQESPQIDEPKQVQPPEEIDLSAEDDQPSVDQTSTEEKYIHYITSIFDEGRSIQLDDGSAWGIGYWKKHIVKDIKTLATWHMGDKIEFQTEWKGALKTWFYITNLENNTTVNAWLLHGAYEEICFKIKEINEKAAVITLTDNSQWIPKAKNNNPSLGIFSNVADSVFIARKHKDNTFYLINTSTYEGICIEVTPYKSIE
ncbi:MAG: hypothetical protein H0W88_08660 [Parachlamydiaceae bacterium]|nr:hypothetical protein [Parachlamydiaceae bacterium]